MTSVAQPSGVNLPDMEMTPEQQSALAVQDISARQYRRAAKAKDDISARAVEDALRSLRLDVPPSEVVRHSPFTASYIRRLARKAGIEGDPRYDRTGGSRT